MPLMAEDVAARRLRDGPASRLGELRRALEALSCRQVDATAAAVFRFGSGRTIECLNAKPKSS